MSTPRLQVSLNAEEDQTLFELRRADKIPQRTKDRATALRLSHRGWKTEQIAEYLNWQVATVRQTIHRWQDEGLYGLWDVPRQGRPRSWDAADMAYLEDTLEQSSATLNSAQLVTQLEQDRQVTLSRRHLRRLLKKRAIDGSAPGTAKKVARTRSSGPPN